MESYLFRKGREPLESKKYGDESIAYLDDTPVSGDTFLNAKKISRSLRRHTGTALCP